MSKVSLYSDFKTFDRNRVFFICQMGKLKYRRVFQFGFKPQRKLGATPEWVPRTLPTSALLIPPHKGHAYS